MWCVQSSERTEKRIRKRPIIAGIDPQKQAKPARFAEDVPEILDQLNSMPLVGIAARQAGWHQHSTYRKNSDIYVVNGLPEIIVPRINKLGDYASVVSELIKIFANVTELDEMSVYRSLVTTDRDLIRLRAGSSQDGSVALSQSMQLIEGAHDM